VDIVKGQPSKLYADGLWRKLAHRFFNKHSIAV
jgi:hypothetical protein